MSMLRSLIGLSSTLRARGTPRRNPDRQGRGKLISKQGNHQFYKGKRVRSVGRINSLGRFKVVDEKLPIYQVPDLEGFELKPYVAYDTPLVKTPPPKLPTQAEALAHYSKVLSSSS
mmetsp:Transcript_18368/g.46697  ORF Transcript_18368/g.46697 Transcript_18368/m.46697 type:complete len:116 (-) Transcript_18368:47-394(-)|eukprot:CAMPEP_0177647908 /NCGR_PEP_ID=MMETSP0447-20121125/10547_1 /TAXON_ID=0 /ORGANISM="Stygamoeba regulata, Strain BSH-02190019" /LENGTH=115 /DNA_ID=CAMNT_0019150517 /DNA_START=163 /DNA_END=510 /DNA_ORIENTATION=+